MTDAGKTIKEWEAVLNRDPLDAPFDLIDETLTVLKEQQREIESMNFIYGFVYGGQVKELRELVRCKDCKRGVKPPTLQYYPNLTWCIQHSTSHNDDWFCADGEKKDAEND